MDVPTSVRALIGQTFRQLPPLEQTLLEAASVAGTRFPAASVAEAAGRDVERKDRDLLALADQGLFLRRCGEACWPDGTASSLYEFQHSLYGEVIYQRLPGAVATRLHERVGLRLERAFARRTADVCHDLARHFGRTPDYQRAYFYHW